MGDKDVFLKNFTKGSLFSGVFERCHNIPLIAADLKTSLKKMPPKPKFVPPWWQRICIYKKRETEKKKGRKDADE